jgi:O-antigen/teichoic acid export membrane protein
MTFVSVSWDRARQAAAVVRLAPFDTSSPEGRSRERYRLIALNSIGAVGARAAAIAVSLATVPITLRYLGRAEYGLWAAITSLTTWVALLDFGVLNGLLNAVAEAHGREDRRALREYVSTACVLLLAAAAAIGATLAVVLPIVPWERVFASSGVVSAAVVRWSVAAAAVPILVGLPLSIVRQVYAGLQRSYVGNVFAVVGSLATLGALLLATRLDAGLPLLILVGASVGVLTSGANMLYLIRWEMPWLAPSWATCSRRALRRLVDTSAPLFLFQLGALVVNNSQLLILAHRATLTTVADYSIIVRLYVTLVSFVTPFREAFERGDVAWVRRSFQRMLAARMAMAVAVCGILLAVGDRLLQLWLGLSGVQFGAGVWLALSLLILSATWVSSFSDLLTILDAVWVQVALVALNGIVTAGLTYVLAPHMGSMGALLSICAVTVLFSSWLLPIAAQRRVRAGPRVPA